MLCSVLSVVSKRLVLCCRGLAARVFGAVFELALMLTCPQGFAVELNTRAENLIIQCC